MRILVVCGAGASSTFVALRINRAARAQQLAYTARASNEASLPRDIEDCDLVLLGSHLAPRLQQVRDLAAPHGVGVLLLDADVLGDLDGSGVLARVGALLAGDVGGRASSVT